MQPLKGVQLLQLSKPGERGRVDACTCTTLLIHGQFSPGVNKSIESSASSISSTYVSMEWSGEKKGVTEQGFEQ